MTIFQIEVRALSEQYDVQAHRLAREILYLPLKVLPAQNTRQPFTLRTAQIYRLTGDLTHEDLEQLIAQLLVDAVVQEARLCKHEALDYHVVDVFFHAGVTDTLAESVLAGAHLLGLAGLEQVETGRRYMLDSRLSESEVGTIAAALLYNPVIQYYEFIGAHLARRPQGSPPPLLSSPTPTLHADHHPRATTRVPTSPSHLPRPYGARLPGIEEDTGFNMSIAPKIDDAMEAAGAERILDAMLTLAVPLCTMTDEQLLHVSRRGLLALNLDEMRAIQHHYLEQGREPDDIELETLAQTWSEHCSHKTFKATIFYREVDSRGVVLEEETIGGLLKAYLMRATESVKPAWLVSAFSDNAGIVRFSEGHDIAIKVETHNHPSAIEPFGGANTGVGGVIRDVLGVSAQPIACTDVLCFGPLDTPAEKLPAGILAPGRVARGVVNGVRDYGNKMGIPTVNGAVLYDEGYLYNPLVFCGCLGILPHGSHPRQVEPGDCIVVLGGRTGRDGIHGATFSSGEMSSESNARAGSAVQIGAPITEKKVADVIVQARDLRLYNAITDCGAGGFSSAIGEMGAGTGAAVELAKAPLKYQGLAPWEIWLSEAQERMVLAVPPKHLEELLEICEIEEVEASIIGSFTDSHRLLVTYRGKTIIDMEMDFLHDGRPARTLDAVWTRVERDDALVGTSLAGTLPLADALLSLLGHPTIASKEAVVRRYDYEVQGATVLKPLVGLAGNGPGDAAVLRPMLDVETKAGIVLSNGINPLYGKLDPYHMAMNAVDEALRNLTAVGGDIARAAILDNFCWGNPTDPVQLGMLVRAVKGCHDAAVGFGTPFISGKDSLNNEYRVAGQRLPVMPTLLISAVGVIDDAAHTIDMSLKRAGNLIYLLGVTRNELAGSHYVEVLRASEVLPGDAGYAQMGSSVPQVDVASARTMMLAVGEAIRKGLVQACHDLSEGGLAVAAAEMSLAGLLGMTLDVGEVMIDEAGRETGGERATNIVLLFSETPSRFLVEVTPGQREAFEAHMRSLDVQDMACAGVVTNNDRFVVYNGGEMLIDLPVAALQKAWKGGLA